jgi:superfamily II DNA/RNA helicase
MEKEVSQAVAAFNQGVYKVIIGSTACIGEGLNLQEKSAALHHFDIPFRPSDFIQRNGRIDRQGNTQNSVELHTYMSAGTIDNYSVSLVQRKANWIDQLLKTKSNVFINPNDENYLDADELLLALTEEWSDKTKAEERRKEIERIKEETLDESRNQQRREQLASLSLLRGALATYTGDKGKMPYQNRLQKIAMLEKMLKQNPTFTEHELVKTSIPFLYAKESDRIIRKGDMFIYRGKPYEVIALNFKRRELQARLMGDRQIRDASADDLIVMPVHEVKEESTATYIAQPDKDERKLLQDIHTEAFYAHNDRRLQEQYYQRHLVCATFNDFQPPVFSVGEDGKLDVKEDRYYGYKYPERADAMNPFSALDMKRIQTAAGKGIAVEYGWKLESYIGLFCGCIPELAELLVQATPKEGENFTESA